MKGLQKFIPLGYLDTDTEPLLLKEGNYTSALNVRPITSDTFSTGATINIRGNEFRFNINPITAHSKSYRIFLEAVAATPRSLTFYNPNGAPLNIASTYNDGATLDLTSTAMRAAVNGLLGINNQVWSFAARIPGSNYDDLTITTAAFETGTNAGWDYILKSTGANPVELLVLQEALSEDMAGPLYPIGSYDLLGDLFIWSTNQKEFPTISAAEILLTANNGVGRVRVQTTIAHGFSSGDEILISDSDSTFTIVSTILTTTSVGGEIRVTTTGAHGLPIGSVAQVTITGAAASTNANGTWYVNVISGIAFDLIGSTPGTNTAGGAVTKHSAIDGKWIINVIDTTHFDLINSIFVLATTHGTIITNLQGVGQVGVATYDINTDTWTYVSLITSKEFNLVTKKQIKTLCQRTNLGNCLYWTDAYNPPRVLYYRGPYVTNGAIEYINPQYGQYAYGTINEETKLFLGNTDISLDFVQQIQAGGQLNAGNWRYAVRFLTSNLNATEWTDLSNPINVFFEGIGLVAANQLSGDESDAVTPKINQLEVTNIIPGLFSFIELGAVNYRDTAIIGFVVKRVQLSDSQTEIILNHSGSETGTTSLDLGTLNIRQIPYLTAQNIDAVDNRLILSNLTSRAIGDLSGWAATFSHSIKQGTVTGVGSNASISTKDYVFGEFFDPENVFSKIGYMQNEVYRMGIKGRFRDTGGFSPVFWIDDIKIDTSATNISTPNRRISGLPNWNLTDIDGGTEVTYIPYIEFSNIDLGFQVDGVAIKDLFEELIFERAEVVQEIIATGGAVLTITDRNVDGSGVALAYADPTTPLIGGAYPFASGYLGVALSGDSYPAWGNRRRDIVKLYSPDTFCIGEAFALNPGDEIINFGNQQISGLYPSNQYIFAGEPYRSSFNEYNGYVNSTPTIHTIVESVPTGTAQQGVSIGGIVYNQVLVDQNPPDGVWINKVGHLLYTSTDLTNVSANADHGFYYIQVRRVMTYTANDPDESKYGDRINTKYIPTGFSYRIEEASPSEIGSGIISVYGGDAMTQKFFVKDRAANVTAQGGAGGVAFYSQNRVNSQMIRRYDNQPSRSWCYPRTTTAAWLQEYGTLGTNSAIYNQGYTPRNGVNADSAFDTSIVEQTDFSTRMIYSELKPNNSFQDLFRIFLPLNFKDLDPTFGSITHHANGNGELYSWQQRSFMRQYFNQRGTLSVSDGTQVLIGNGSVFGQDGQTLSTIGCRHVWGVVKGKSAQGNDTFYWINTELKKFIRLGYDGSTVSLSDVKGMQSFFANNLKWVHNQDTPADNFGIHGVWNTRYSEALFTVRGINEEILLPPTWNEFTMYTSGFTVRWPRPDVDTFNVIGDYYISLRATAGEQPDIPAEPSAWQQVPFSDPSQFNQYTIVLNEFKGAFIAFYTPTPKIYLGWQDTYLSPRPALNDDTMKIYEHDKGQYCSWYDDNISVQEQNGHLEALIYGSHGSASVPSNVDEVKWWDALRVDTEVSPFRFDFKNRTQESFLTAGEIEGEEGYFQSSIKEDSTVTLINDGDTSLLYGKWLKVKMTFEKLIYQRLTSMTVKFRLSPRLNNK